jgi:predicted dehydrogenase
MGVIGAGSMGRNHLRIVSEVPAFELVGLFDTDTETARNAARQFGTRAFERLSDLLDEADAVSVAAPSSCHMEVALAAAERRCHILLEKPIALHSGDARRIIGACDDAGVTLMVGHIERYNPVFIELVKVLEHVRILTLSFRRLSPFDPRTGDASVVQDLMIHDIDLLCALTDAPVTRIASHGICVYSEKPDHAQALIAFENGLIADITASRITESKVRRIEVTAQNAYIAADLLTRSIQIMRQTRFIPGMERSTGYRQENIVEKVYVPMGEPLRAEFAHFAECVTTGGRPRTDGESALKALMICERITEGLKSGGGK